jgi:hypothetical protein
MAAGGFATDSMAVRIMTAFGDRERLLSFGFDGYTPKPLAAEGFVGQIAGFLESRLHSKCL